MALRRIFAYISMIIGSLCTFSGVAFSAMYVYGAIIDRWGEADQSLLFWHLPILFLGIFAIAVGLFMSFWGINRIKSDPSS
jgi:H+/Cl- antiporter ClcA